MKLDKIKQLDATKKQKSTVGNANAKLIPPHSIIYEGSDKYTQFLEQVGTGQTAVSVESVQGALEEQVGGDHYKKFKIQPWEIVDEYDLGFYSGNVLKYLLRVKTNKLEDLKKARHYLDKLIEDLDEGMD
tara:strand:+ start:1812 stop:2201 length:390 start_codon:yes stop_codon:yes gene_type:complete